ncbi:MAG: tyrosine recombinase XerC [Ruminococcaceae bacterium]|nr:tyrosine recombinase XerC [Oscillospiraceae bacterium]
MNYKDAPSFLKSFVMQKKVIENRSDLTVNEYCLDLCNFFKYTYAKKTKTDIDKVDLDSIGMDFVVKTRSEDIYDYMIHVSVDKANKPSARARKLVSIRGYFAHLRKEKIIEENPAADIVTPSVKPALPKYLSLNESKRLLEAISLDPNNTNKERDYAMLVLFLNCGMRLSELVGININDINFQESKLVVTGKGNKQRTVYLNDMCIDAVNSYMKIRRSLPCKDANALFVSRNNNRISNKTVQWTVKKYLTLAGLGGKGLSTHKLRHTAATLMYGTGQVDIRVLKDILGHEQLNTTQIYTHVSDAQMKQAIDLNPLSNKDKN